MRYAYLKYLETGMYKFLFTFSWVGHDLYP